MHLKIIRSINQGIDWMKFRNKNYSVCWEGNELEGAIVAVERPSKSLLQSWSWNRMAKWGGSQTSAGAWSSRGFLTTDHWPHPWIRASDPEGLGVGRGPDSCLSKEPLSNADGTLAASGKGKIKNPNLISLNIWEAKWNGYMFVAQKRVWGYSFFVLFFNKIVNL